MAEYFKKAEQYSLLISAGKECYLEDQAQLLRR